MLLCWRRDVDLGSYRCGTYKISQSILQTVTRVKRLSNPLRIPAVNPYLFRNGLGPSLRIRSVIWVAALAKACAWLPDM
jgi:hypothetical protein